MNDEISIKDYKTVTYKNIDIDVSAELLQDIYGGTQPLSILQDHVKQKYSKSLSIIRSQKIDLLLND